MSLRKLTVCVVLFIALALSTGAIVAQTSGSNVVIFVVICQNQAIVNLSGNMQTGYDLYYQVYSDSQGGGNPITALRQVSVNGAYQYSETVPYNTGAIIPAGHVSSLYVTISREGSPEASIYSTYVDDLQDGCAQPQFQPGTSTTIGGTTPEEAAEEAGETGETPPSATCPPLDPDTLPYIWSPFGGYLNPGYIPSWGPPCGPGEWKPPRQETAGLVFVECNQFPMAEPGVIYNTDEVTLFWSWYARTEAQVQEHIDTVQYSVTYFDNHLIPVPYVIQSEIEYRWPNWWVFYTVPLGHLRPGHYGISYNVQWERAISDGYDEFGPGTEYETLHGDCSFNVLSNPDGEEVYYTNWPPRYGN